MPSSCPRHLASSLVVGCLLLSGCQWGSAGFTGSLGPRTFDPNGTVFSYLDGFDDNLVVDDRPRVAVMMTWLIFNPTGDLNDLDGATLEDYRHEASLRDMAAIVFDDQVDVTPGASFESRLEGGVETSADGVSVRLHFAPERLTALTTYDAFQPFGSIRTAKVDIDTATFGPPMAGVGGRLTVTVELNDDDPADALSGTLQGTFSAPLVDERVAEHNLGLLGAEELVGLPLEPRVATP